MITVVKSRKRLLRKRVYRSSNHRQRNNYFRENRNISKPYQEEYKESHIIRKKRRPKREVNASFKMAYRYRYYNSIDDMIIEDE